ncbi:ImmA/IrrE family metallo-endopeptidase [Paracoccus sp. TK19116]|uniref:ImmA/IrrE family metallo-endopeptidase n=1 Tax=Paracoccus albicereus TaxID=2922394 RepID=A0ABT1MP85_9RHOB|nr:ImmA/IrrE family metallo-endopeptidase [Paracoccus albicereus]MCQ0970103.1 ImmA/IrrE family metallo-endopeptidase [Paracoccus albicereus]
MTAPRKDWARCEGERIARRFGWTTLPVDPFAIARSEDITVSPLPEADKGVSGVFHIRGHDAFIFYRETPRQPGRERFSVAHELGHFFLEGHPAMIADQGGRHESRAGSFLQRQPIEVEADHFAAGLLMPTAPLRTFLADAPVGLEAIKRLRQKAKVSISAAAITYAQQADHPVAIIVSKGQRIQYAFQSPGLRALGRLIHPRKDDPLPAGATSHFNSDPSNVAVARQVCGATTAQIWFDGGGALPLDEEVLGLGTSGATLTVLSSEDLPRGDPDDSDDEDDDQPWSPTFR